MIIGRGAACCAPASRASKLPRIRNLPGNAYLPIGVLRSHRHAPFSWHSLQAVRRGCRHTRIAVAVEFAFEFVAVAFRRAPLTLQFPAPSLLSRHPEERSDEACLPQAGISLSAIAAPPSTNYTRRGHPVPIFSCTYFRPYFYEYFFAPVSVSVSRGTSEPPNKFKRTAHGQTNSCSESRDHQMRNRNPRSPGTRPRPPPAPLRSLQTPRLLLDPGSLSPVDQP